MLSLILSVQFKIIYALHYNLWILFLFYNNKIENAYSNLLIIISKASKNMYFFCVLELFIPYKWQLFKMAEGIVEHPK